MQKWMLLVIALLGLGGAAMSCAPKPWSKDDPRKVTPEPTIVVDERVRVDLSSNSVNAR
jgi:hypothetical protein